MRLEGVPIRGFLRLARLFLRPGRWATSGWIITIGFEEILRSEGALIKLSIGGFRVLLRVLRTRGIDRRYS